MVSIKRKKESKKIEIAKNTRKKFFTVVKKLKKRKTKKIRKRYARKERDKRTIYGKNPVIGVVSIPNTFGKHKRTHSYIPESYVKWLQMSGAQVVPLQYDLPPTILKYILRQCNGVLFIGGQVDEHMISREYYDFMQTMKIIFNFIRAENNRGNHYPIFAICLGFEILAMLDINPNVIAIEKKYNKYLGISNVKARNYVAKNIFLPKKSALSSIFTPQEKKYQATHPVVYENHGLGFLLSAPYMKEYLKKWDVLAIAHENKKNGRKYVNILEYKKYPFYGVQFHPEKVLFEWLIPDIPHTDVPYKISRKLSAFFVNECKKTTGHEFITEIEFGPYGERFRYCKYCNYGL